MRRRCAESHKSVLSRLLLRSQYEAVPDGPHPRGHWVENGGTRRIDDTIRQRPGGEGVYDAKPTNWGTREEKKVISGQSGGVSTAHDGERSLSAKFQPQVLVQRFT